MAPIKVIVFIFTCVHVSLNAAFSTKLNSTVELAIFCDLEFGKYFQFNETKIREYWVTRMFDVDLKFKTLPSVDIQFVVTSIKIINDTSGQPFVEESRDHNNLIRLDPILQKFSEWITKSGDKIDTSFDVALLALGAETNSDIGGRGYVGGACNTIGDRNRKAGTAIVRLVEDNWWNNCNYLELVLSLTLGAYSPSKTYPEECTGKNHIKPGHCNETKYFFPSCADRDISEFARNATCLHKVDVTNPTMFTKKELTMQPPSIQEQCAIQINNKMASINQTDENRCKVSNCYLKDEAGNINVEQKLYSFENSPCDDNKSCFRGRCIHNGYTIVNVASSKCLHSTNRFSSEDSVSLVDCPEISNQLDRFVVTKTFGQTVSLWTPYITEDSPENFDKCFAFNSAVGHIAYQKCGHEANLFHWELLSLENEKGEFLIRHKISMRCLAAATDRSNLVMSSCDINNTLSVWKFDTTFKITKDIFLKYYNVFPTAKPTNPTAKSKTLTSVASRLGFSIVKYFTVVSVIMSFVGFCIYSV